MKRILNVDFGFWVAIFPAILLFLAVAPGISPETAEENLDRYREIPVEQTEIISKGGEAVEIFADFVIVTEPNGEPRLRCDRDTLDRIIIHNLDLQRPIVAKKLGRIRIRAERMHGG